MVCAELNQLENILANPIENGIGQICSRPPLASANYIVKVCSISIDILVSISTCTRMADVSKLIMNINKWHIT